jgi:penicillin amidase
MELMRRAAYGRLAEVAGEAAVELDHLLRLVDFPRAGEASIAMMPAATRDWAQGFADGINAVAAHGPLPPEFEIFGIAPEPWTVQDLFAVSRLCSADYAWKVWRTLNPLRKEEDWARLWAELVGVDSEVDEEIAAGPRTPDDALEAFTRAGSNAFALAGERSASGRPLFACDPHHIITAPGLWLIAGLRTPSVAVWGLMIPALPVFGVGRNTHGAWGGTNLHATSSELIDVSGEPIETAETPITVRGGRTRTVTTRQSALGPVISDARPFAMPDGPVALHWLGHRPSDEFTPFRRLMHAESWDGFADAVDAYSLPGLNMLWADTGGTIGKMIAARVPKRPLARPRDFVISRQEAHESWADMLSARQLPHEVNPPEGFVSSANEGPKDPPVTISLFFAPDNRVRRIAELLGDRRGLTADDLAAIQEDVYFAPARILAGRLSTLADAAGLSGPVVAALRPWDGHYRADSAGALAFELVAAGLVEHLEARAPRKTANAHWRPFSRLERLAGSATDEELTQALTRAVAAAAKPFSRHGTWGSLHRVRLVHPLGRLPWLSGRLPSLDFPSGGSNDTIMKSMHRHTRRAHATGFGANARFVADLADIDATWAVVLGGQDGWPGSRSMFDQVGHWRRGERIHLPLSPDALARACPHVTTVEPAR